MNSEVNGRLYKSASGYDHFFQIYEGKEEILVHVLVFFLQLLYDKYCICCTFPWTKSILHVVDCDQFSESAL